jgi:hypothetical protein
MTVGNKMNTRRKRRIRWEVFQNLVIDGYTSLVNLPSFGTLAEMVSRGRDVISINEVFLAAQERILREQNEIRGAEHRNNSVVSSQFETAEGPYERAAPALSPSRTRKRKH